MFPAKLQPLREAGLRRPPGTPQTMRACLTAASSTTCGPGLSGGSLSQLAPAPEQPRALQITLVGKIVSREELSTYTKCVLDDGTGKADVTAWSETENQELARPDAACSSQMPLPTMHNTGLAGSCRLSELAWPAQADQQRQDWQVGKYVRVHGHLRSFDGRMRIQSFNIRPITDFNEVLLSTQDICSQIITADLLCALAVIDSAHAVACSSGSSGSMADLVRGCR